MDRQLRVPLVPIPDDVVDAVDSETESDFRTEFASSGDSISNVLNLDDAELDDSCATAWSRFLKRGYDWESARVNHKYPPEERARLNKIESIDYLPPNSEVHRDWLDLQPHHRAWDRWLMMGAIGATTGCVGYCLYTSINLVASMRLYIYHHFTPGLSWFLNSLLAVSLAFLSAASVVYIAPAASGSGVPDVMAFLNGCSVPKVFNIVTCVIKIFATFCAVASGLPVGPEGPMIHIGACIGAGLSQAHSTTLGFDTYIFSRFRNPKDKRDFVTAGVAVGVATAFGAPIGGLLFAFEEVASFWQQDLCWKIFFACVSSVLTLNILESAQKAFVEDGHFGLFHSETLFEVKSLANHLLAVLPAVVIGLLCGMLAVLFTGFNLKVSRLRDAILKERKLWKIAEPCVLAFMFIAGTVLLPLAFPCVAVDCVVNNQNDLTPQCTTNNTYRVVENPETLCRCQPLHDSLSGGGSHSFQNAIENRTVYYNELATLMSATGEDGIRHLLARGTHREFGYGALTLMLVWYSLGAVCVAGTSISSGLFVPMMMIGACVGRLVGLVTTDIAAGLGQNAPGLPPGVFQEDSPYAGMDPGVFAFVGAAAFMGGVTRLTVSLAVIMIEVSNDVHMLLPVLVGIILAKWVADAWTHSLYHGLLEVKCVPFLDNRPVSSRSLDLIEVCSVMHKPVVTLREQMKVDDLRHVLRATTHNGFPIVRETSNGDVFVGLVTRDHLVVLLKVATARRSAKDLRVPYTELKRVAITKQVHLEQQQAVLVSRSEHSAHFGQLENEMLDLEPYINKSAVTVCENFSVERTYILFRTMGLRHLVVVDENNHVKGMVTRKDLLGFQLDKAVNKANRRRRRVRHLGDDYPRTDSDIDVGSDA